MDVLLNPIQRSRARLLNFSSGERSAAYAGVLWTTRFTAQEEKEGWKMVGSALVDVRYKREKIR